MGASLCMWSIKEMEWSMASKNVHLNCHHYYFTAPKRDAGPIQLHANHVVLVVLSVIMYCAASCPCTFTPVSEEGSAASFQFLTLCAGVPSSPCSCVQGSCQVRTIINLSHAPISIKYSLITMIHCTCKQACTVFVLLLWEILW